MKWTPNIEKIKGDKNKVPDGQLGFESPQMTQEVVRQLLDGGRNISPLHWIDPRYAIKTRY